MGQSNLTLCENSGLTCIYSLGNGANFLSTMLRGNGVPNDALSNFNSFAIIIGGPLLNVRIAAAAAIANLFTWSNFLLCSMRFTLSCATLAFTTDPLPVSRRASLSVLLEV